MTEPLQLHQMFFRQASRPPGLAFKCKEPAIDLATRQAEKANELVAADVEAGLEGPGPRTAYEMMWAERFMAAVNLA